MSNLVITGQVPCEVDHTYSITLTRLSCAKVTPTQVKKGAFGPIGTAQGIPDCTATLTFAVPTSSLEFDFDSLSAKPGGFTISFSTGGNKFALLGCHVNNDAFENDPGAGNLDNTIGITSTERVRL